LGISEAVGLKISDIDSQRTVIRVEQGKGRKDRYAMLSLRLLAVLLAIVVPTGQRVPICFLPGARAVT